MTSLADIPSRPMRRRSREITDRAEIDAIVGADRVMHLALASNDVPFLVPVFYGYDGTSLYFHSASAGTKIAILKENNRVCFEISVDQGVVVAEEPCDFEARHRTVIGFGRASFVTDEAEKVRALDLIVKKFTDTRFDYPKGKLSITTVVRIDIDGIKGKSYGIGEPRPEETVEEE
ncbi:putative nitroimidazole resistance protein [Rhodovulum sp. PH10]|uniref:pyridoxamine 5'-phosphate oxidase family protein n=1 Tax=Rhodovulum sp. PH10 TaxID=1187851 RepID=UPI00027C222E|nr:pyridoxamine 5'-phosphate oxidase family protein [Rhodovulum sp. PH10]EJW10898.1 putative nitroimidazole resistance protein [Rhodovulum sp. PH10]